MFRERHSNVKRSDGRFLRIKVVEILDYRWSSGSRRSWLACLHYYYYYYYYIIIIIIIIIINLNLSMSVTNQRCPCSSADLLRITFYNVHKVSRRLPVAGCRFKTIFFKQVWYGNSYTHKILPLSEPTHTLPISYQTPRLSLSCPNPSLPVTCSFLLQLHVQYLIPIRTNTSYPTQSPTYTFRTNICCGYSKEPSQWGWVEADFHRIIREFRILRLTFIGLNASSGFFGWLSYVVGTQKNRLNEAELRLTFIGLYASSGFWGWLS